MKNNRHFTDALFEEFDYVNDEVDNLLTEDLDAMLKYYNNLQNWDRQELLNFLIKDPTWNNNKEQGQYSKWILDKLNRDLLNSSHLGHLHDVLKRFEDNKKYLINKDINKFKSIQEIDAHLNDDNNYNELSHSQAVRQHRRDKQKADLDNEAKLIYENSDWEIWIPKTYAASCKLGQGSRWCTASTETNKYFYDYSDNGDLYIILNKHNEKEKYQFHFESESYMDINDKKVNLLDLNEKENNKKWISALRQYNKDFDKQCEDVFNKTEKVREELNNFLRKIKSTEIIKYPTHGDIVKELSEIARSVYQYLTDEEYNKIKNIRFKLEIENQVRNLENTVFIHHIKDQVNQVIFEANSKLIDIEDRVFSDWHNLVEIELPDSITKIGKYAFCRCNNLESIKLPSNLLRIGQCVFSGCKKLKNVIIPKNTEYIGTGAFYSCESLTSITIPSSVKKICSNAFEGCTSLKEVIFEESSQLTNIGDSAFDNCKSLTSITIPESVTSIGYSAFEECSKNILIKTSNQYVIDYCIENKIKYEKID